MLPVSQVSFFQKDKPALYSASTQRIWPLIGEKYSSTDTMELNRFRTEPSVKFGWKRDDLLADPTTYKLSLRPEDITWTEDKSPVTSLIGGRTEVVGMDAAAQKRNERLVPRLRPDKLQLILDKLSRTDLENPNTPGFLVIAGLEKTFRNVQAMELFFRWLMVDLSYVINNTPAYRDYYQLQDSAQSLVMSALGYLADGRQAAFVNSNGATVQYPPYSHKNPHFDNAPVVAGLMYLPTRGVEGGIPQIFDPEDYMRQHPKLGIPMSELVDRGELVVDKDKEELSPGLLAQADFDDVTMTLVRDPSTPMLVLFNNKGPNRVAHGATPLRVVDTSGNHRRDIVRYTLVNPAMFPPHPKGEVPKFEDRPQYWAEYQPLSDDELVGPPTE